MEVGYTLQYVLPPSFDFDESQFEEMGIPLDRARMERHWAHLRASPAVVQPLEARREVSGGGRPARGLEVGSCSLLLDPKVEEGLLEVLAGGPEVLVTEGLGLRRQGRRLQVGLRALGGRLRFSPRIRLASRFGKSFLHEIGLDMDRCKGTS